MKSSRIIFVLLLAVVMVVAMGCSKKEDAAAAPAGKTQVTFMTPLSGADGGIMDQIIKAFNESTPDVEVTHLVVGASAEYKQKLSTGISTNSAPEICLIRKFDMPLYMDQFSGFTAGEYKAAGIDINDVFPNLVTGLKDGDTYYGIPLDVWVFYAAYNKANFKKAGLDPDKFPANAAEFEKAMTAVKKITPEGITPYYETFSWSWIFAHLLWQFGGDYLTEDWKAPAFKEGGVKVLNYLLDLQKKGIIASGAVDAGPAFESGDATVLITGIWTINPWKDLFKDDFGYAPAPMLGNTKAVFGGSHVITLVETMVKDKNKKEAAMKWVKYLWDHMIDWYAAGQTPSRKSLAESEELKTKLPHIYEVAKANQYVKSFQMFPYISEIVDNTLPVYLEAVLFTHEMTPEQAMDKATAEAQQIIDDYWAQQ